MGDPESDSPPLAAANATARDGAQRSFSPCLPSPPTQNTTARVAEEDAEALSPGQHSGRGLGLALTDFGLEAESPVQTSFPPYPR